jgi:fluoride exporter
MTSRQGTEVPVAGKLLGLALLGAIGTLARYGLGGIVQRHAGSSFPWGTLAVNAVGCFAFGIIWSLVSERSLLRGEARTIVLIGFLGAFTTFSSFAFETVQMLRDGQWIRAVANVGLQNFIGLTALLVGAGVGRSL